MERSARPNPWVRFTQKLVEVAAVAQSRYGSRQDRPPVEAQRPSALDSASGQSDDSFAQEIPSPYLATKSDAQPREGSADERPLSAPGAAAAGAAEGGSAKQQESRERIGDPDAPPAPREPTSLPDACRHHVLPHGIGPTFLELFRRFGQDQCSAFAAALAFFALLSLVPVMLVALSALAFIFPNPHEAMVRLMTLVGNMLPGAAAKGEIQHLLVEKAHVDQSVNTLIHTRGIAGLIGVLSLLWTSIQIFVNAAPAMNAAYEVQETRGWLRLRLVAFGLFVGAGILFLLSLLPSSGPDFIRNLHIPWLGLPKHVPWYIDGLFWLVALAINIAMFALIYKFLPNTPTRWSEAFVGGAVTGVLWELAKRGFAWYLSQFANYNKVYGGLGALIILLLWIYYTAMILLLGAEVAALYEDFRQAARGPQPEGAPGRAAASPPSTTRARV